MSGRQGGKAKPLKAPKKGDKVETDVSSLRVSWVHRPVAIDVAVFRRTSSSRRRSRRSRRR
jgi:hypothetical protein